MARRISASQLRNKIRQAQQKQRQAVNKYNQAVRQHNQKVRTAVNKYNSAVNRYNQEVRAHNSRVRANRARLRSQISRLNSHSATTSTRYVVYRTSVQTLHDAYTRLENRSESNQIGPEYNRFVDLAERETANSAEVANRLAGTELDGADNIDNLHDAALGDQLRKFSADLNDRWQGAVFALSPQNPDAARHFCTSVREIFTQILEISAPDSDVFTALPDSEKTDHGNATRRSKIRYLLHHRGMLEDTLEDFVETNMQNVVELFHVFNDGTHGSAGTFGHGQLTAIKKRVEDGIEFLTEIIGIA